MNLFKDVKVQKYISSFGEKNPVPFTALFECQCFKSPPNNDHKTTAEPTNSPLFELAVSQGDNLKSIVTYINQNNYLNGNLMMFLVEKMLQCSDFELVEDYYQILECNIILHPPCAPYMKSEYDTFMSTYFRDYFNNMTLWGFLVFTFQEIVEGSHSYDTNNVSDFAFKMCLKLCVSILQVDFEVSKRNNCKSLIMKCLNYNHKRATRLPAISKLLDMLFNTGYDFRMHIIDLAYIIKQMTT